MADIFWSPDREPVKVELHLAPSPAISSKPKNFRQFSSDPSRTWVGIFDN